MRDRGPCGLADEVEAVAERLSRRIRFTELIQKPAVFLVGLGRRPQRDDRFEIAPRLAPEFIAQAKPSRREQQVRVFASLTEPGFGTVQLFGRIRCLDEPVKASNRAAPLRFERGTDFLLGAIVFADPH